MDIVFSNAGLVTSVGFFSSSISWNISVISSPENLLTSKSRNSSHQCPLVSASQLPSLI